jgi:hypothetical protein
LLKILVLEKDDEVKINEKKKGIRNKAESKIQVQVVTFSNKVFEQVPK